MAFAALVWPATAPAQVAEVTGKLEPLELREFNPETAEWQKLALTEPERFERVNWRSQAWGGSDLEILVPVTGDPETEIGKPLSVVVKSVDTRKVVIRRRYTGVQIGTTGRAYQSVVLREAACDGNLEVVATFAGQTQKLRLGLECYE